LIPDAKTSSKAPPTPGSTPVANNPGNNPITQPVQGD